ncbi:MAG TPA: Uma2 family endonuclease [Desulfotomaculum sp.]|nr:Uma2 family endonuclease [Desulfotomaculum sp.]
MEMDVALQSVASGITYEDYCKLDDGNRYELIGGELYVVPSPSAIHQNVFIALAATLYHFVLENQLGRVFTAPLDVYLTPKDLVQPDIIFISRERTDIIAEQNIQGAPDLVVEILSPSTAARDRTLKKELYARHGVRELWIIHPLAQTVEVYRPIAVGFGDPIFYDRRGGVTVTSPLLPGLELDLNKIF